MMFNDQDLEKGHDCRRVVQASLKHEPDVGIRYDADAAIPA